MTIKCSAIPFESLFKTVFTLGIPSFNFGVPSSRSGCPLSYPSEKFIEFLAPSLVCPSYRIHAHSNAHLLLWSLVSHLDVNIPASTSFALPLLPSPLEPLSFIPLLCSASGTLFTPLILKDFQSSIYSLMCAPHWVPVSRLSYFIRAGMHKMI